MRESIDESKTIELVIAVIIIFVAFMCMMVAFSKSVKMKNEVLSIIEKYNGFLNGDAEPDIKSSSTCKIIAKYLKANGYVSNGRIPDSNYIGININIENGGCEACAGPRCSFWIRQNSVKNSYLYNYDVVIFFNIGLPFMEYIASFPVKGETIDLKAKSIIKGGEGKGFIK